MGSALARQHSFIIATVAVGLFTDLFLYGLIVPILPFMLRDRVDLPEEKVQAYVSAMLAAYAGASVLFSLPAGIIADKVKTRQAPFLSGLAALLAATIILAFGQSIPVLMLARVLQGTSSAFVWTVGLAMLLDTVGPGDLGKTIGSVSADAASENRIWTDTIQIFSFISVGELLAPVVGGFLYDKVGYGGVFGLGSAILAVDFIMRILLIEKKVAARYDSTLLNGAANPRHHSTENGGAEANKEADEEDALLPKKKEKEFKIPEGQNRFIRSLPILYCLSDPRLLTALFVAFVQATLLATFDATIPTEAEALFGFSSLDAGLLFIALDVPYLLLGPLAGWAVDKYGTKPAAVLGFGYLVPTLVLLRLAQPGGKNQIILYSALLALCGVGMAVIGSPSIVEASNVVQEYDKANPGFFGEQGPYAQLYGFNSIFFCAGLTAGPILGGSLRDSIGYGNMNAVAAAISGIIAVLSFIFIGGTPKFLSWKSDRLNNS